MIYILPATVKRLDMPVSPSGSLGYIINSDIYDNRYRINQTDSERGGL
jgi:hypothetical protein